MIFFNLNYFQATKALEEKEKQESEMSQKLKLLKKDQEKDKIKLTEANDKIHRYLQRLATFKLHPIEGLSHCSRLSDFVSCC